MKRKTLVTLCTAALLLTGCSNTTPSMVTSGGSDEAASTGNTSITSTSKSTSATSPENSTLDSSSNDNSFVDEEPSFEVSPDHYTIEAVEPTLEASTKESANTAEPGNAYYYHEFKGTTHNTGAPMSYDDVMDMLKVGEDEHGEYIDSFFLVETVKALSLDECNELAGWSEDYSDRTIYKVNVLKDLISGEDVNRTEYIFVSMGNIQWQDAGDPIYAPGEKFTVVLAKPQEGCDFLRTPGSFMFRYDAIEASDGNIELYARNNPIDTQELDSADEIDTHVITSTTLNPANYTQKITLTKLVDFISADWQEREISTTFNEGV